MLGLGRFPEMGQKQNTEKKERKKLDISSSYAKILGQKLFRTRQFPQSGSKAKDGEKKKRKKRLNDGNNNGQLRIANTTSGGARKAAWANFLNQHLSWKLLRQKISADNHYSGL